MNRIELWECSHCKTQYNDKKKCQECENGHKTPNKVVKGKYIALANNKTGYPVSIDVEMSDGKVVTYKRA